MMYEQERKVAIAAVTAAASLCQQVRLKGDPATLSKQDLSPVTIADFGAQAIICRAIGRAFPTDAIVAEESGTMLRQPEMADPLQKITQAVRSVIPEAHPEAVITWVDHGKGGKSERFWTLDPIDGTKGFLRGDQYAIALALIEQGDIKLGVLACPALRVDAIGPEAGVIFVAVRGQGTTLLPLTHRDGQPSYQARPNAPVLRLAESVEAGHGNPQLQRAVAQAVGLALPPLQMDSQAKYGAIACGQAALYLRLPWTERPTYQENIWDHAAGAIVVEEVGGRVTDMVGKPLDFTQGAQLVNNRGIVASHGVCHDAVLEALAASSRD
jgi:3'(2'), 5'-bisphosphate nucleotidase